MAYASVADMQAFYGDRELIQVSDRTGSGNMDSIIIDKALNDASSEADSYLPAPAVSANRSLVRHVAAIARFLLHKDGASNEIRERYTDAISWLNKAAMGRVSYDDTPLATPTKATPIASSLVLPHESLQVAKTGRRYLW